MNEYDTNRIFDIVSVIGYERTNVKKEADCFVLNTCHIREKATEKVYHEIGRVKKDFRNSEKPLVIVSGCVAQAESEEMIKRESYIDMVIGPQSYHKIGDLILDYYRKKKKIVQTEFDVIGKFDELETFPNKQNKISSYITIQEGCDKFCNFCVVPYTRGTEYSRSVKEIMDEANKLILNGAKEIVLLGQNVNAYNYRSENKNFKLSYLIRELNKIEDLKRIRYTTSHPSDMTDDLINCYKDVKKLMPFLHLPVQSGSDKILKKMNRKYTREQYLSIVKKMKEISPNIEFSSDFIVGYPGESDKDFEDTIDLVKKVNFVNSFSFIYNKRPGTPASNLESVDKGVQKKRLIILQNLLEEIQKKKNKKSIGKFKEVLVENRLKNQNKFFGRTFELTPVVFDASEKDVGKIIDVEIQDCNQNSLFGSKSNSNKEVAA